MKTGRLETIKDFKILLKELATGLRQLTFGDNFDTFLVELSLAASEERANIRNPLKVIPKGYIIVDKEGSGNVTKGDAAWTTDYISFKNTDGSNSITVKIRVLKEI